jgi:hypothetical protein
MNARALLLGGVSLLLASGITLVLGDMDEHRWVPLDDPAIQ